MANQQLHTAHPQLQSDLYNAWVQYEADQTLPVSMQEQPGFAKSQPLRERLASFKKRKQAQGIWLFSPSTGYSLHTGSVASQAYAEEAAFNIPETSFKL